MPNYYIGKLYEEALEIFGDLRNEGYTKEQIKKIARYILDLV